MEAWGRGGVQVGYGDLAVHEHGEEPVAEGWRVLGFQLVILLGPPMQREERVSDLFGKREGMVGGGDREKKFKKEGRGAFAARGSGHVADSVFPEVDGAAEAAPESAEGHVPAA